MKNKNKYNTASDSALGGEENGSGTGFYSGAGGVGFEDGGDGTPLNIMYDKRVFRGNTYNIAILK